MQNIEIEGDEEFCKNCGLMIYFGQKESTPGPWDKYDPGKKDRDGKDTWRHFDSGNHGCNKLTYAEPGGLNEKMAKYHRLLDAMISGTPIWVPHWETKWRQSKIVNITRSGSVTVESVRSGVSHAYKLEEVQLENPLTQS